MHKLTILDITNNYLQLLFRWLKFFIKCMIDQANASLKETIVKGGSIALGREDFEDFFENISHLFRRAQCVYCNLRKDEEDAKID